MEVARRWIIELAEFDALLRADASTAKAFITRRTEQYRPPYGRHVVERPRPGVLAGTSNKLEINKDETGGRRFWPVTTGTIDTEGLTRDRDQLWAEAVARYRQGEEWWLTDPRMIAHARK